MPIGRLVWQWRRQVISHCNNSLGGCNGLDGTGRKGIITATDWNSNLVGIWKKRFDSKEMKSERQHLAFLLNHSKASFLDPQNKGDISERGVPAPKPCFRKSNNPNKRAFEALKILLDIYKITLPFPPPRAVSSQARRAMPALLRPKFRPRPAPPSKLCRPATLVLSADLPVRQFARQSRQA